MPDAEQFYIATVKTLSTAQDQILQHMANGNLVGETVEQTGMMYIQAHSRLKSLTDIKEEIRGLYAKMTDAPAEQKSPKEEVDDGSEPATEIY